MIVGRSLTKAFPLTKIDFLRRWFGLRSRGDEFVALNRVDLQVGAHQFLGVLGKNGAGKSTLLRLLGSVFPPDTGTVQLSGETSLISEMGQFVNPNLTGRQVAQQYIRLMHPHVQNLEKAIESVNDFAELDEYFDEPTRTYSSGMLARLIFSIATEVQESLYLIDEFLVVGDQYFVDKAWARIAHRLGSGASGVLSTHDWTAVLRLCRESLVLDGGRVIDQGPTAKVVARYLNIPQPSDPHATLIVDEAIEAANHNFAEFEFGIRQARLSNLEIAWSIEQFSVGQGWENLLHQDYVPIPSTIGLTKFRVTYEQIQVDTGHYVLNLFLRRKHQDGTSMPVDARSWTRGNGIDLRIRGQKLRSPVVPDVQWSFREPSDD